MYTHNDIVALGDGRYLVQSQADPLKTYEVDLETYTCNCLDYPLIEFCKHICAVQTLFQEEHEDAPNTPEVPSLPLLPPELPLPSKAAPPLDANITMTQPATRISAIVEKLERVAARLRRPRKTAVPNDALATLSTALDSMLLATDDSRVLPSAQHLAPVVKDATARQSMMPKVKTKRAAA
jgi:hypothetical protein